MRVAGRLLLVALLLVAALPSRASAQRDRDPAPAGDAGAPARVVERDDGMSTFSAISLMVLAAGVGGMAVSLAGSRARARAAAATVSRSRPAPKPEVVKAAAATPAGAAAKRAEGQRAGGQAAAARPVPKPAPVNARAPERPAAGPVKAAAPERKPGQVKRAPVERPAAKPAARGAPARVKVTPPDAKRAPAEHDAVAPAAPAQARDRGHAAEPAPTAASVGEAPAGWEACRIGLWSGYVKRQFYAESPSGELVAQSPFFRLEKGCSMEDSQHAAEAFADLLQDLSEAGWEVAGRRRGSWDVALRRRTGVPQPVH